MSVVRRDQIRAGWLLSAPAWALLLTLLILPSAAVLGLSVTDYQFGGGAPRWVGLDNYAALLDDRTVRTSLWNTVVYVAVVAPIAVFAALWIAVLIADLGRVGGVLRTVFFLPVTATIVAIATAWEVVLHPSFGMVNVVLDLFGVDKQRFLGNPDLALGTVMTIGVWKMLGYNILLFLAGIGTIDRRLYEAAALDGADDGWRRFTLVTWPMLAPVTLFVSTITLIRSFSEFETVAVLTLGGPNGATEVLLYTLHTQAFRYFDIGLASALAVVFLGTVAALSFAKIRFFDRRMSHD
ncbi:MAG: sugar ABC transporter permease [Pseudomonadota bacterium]